jgi:hypothetical protein
MPSCLLGHGPARPAALNASARARAYSDQLRACGLSHYVALRRLGNRLAGAASLNGACRVVALRSSRAQASPPLTAVFAPVAVSGFDGGPLDVAVPSGRPIRTPRPRSSVRRRQAAALAHGSPAPNHRKARKCEPGADPGYQRAQCQQACHTKILYRGRGQLAALFAESGQIT